MVTAELAVAIPALVLVLGVLLGGLLLGIDQVRCVDAARAGARSLARGDGVAVATAAAARVGPRGATVGTSVTGDEVGVVVRLHRVVPGLGVGFDLSSRAVADREQLDQVPP